MTGILVFRAQIQRFIELVQRFVQDELGCGCPEEVFEQVKILTGEATPAATDLGMVIGERLFVGFVQAESIRPVETKAHKLVLSGVTYRDSMKLNRIRFVIEGQLSEQEKFVLESEAGKCEKVHIHYFD